MDVVVEGTGSRAARSIPWRRNVLTAVVVAVVLVVAQVLLNVLTEDAGGNELPALGVHRDEAVMAFVGYPLAVFVSVLVILTIVSWFRARSRR